MATASEGRIPPEIRPIYEDIVSRTDAFCRERLNEEYAGLCRKLAATLARKRPSPFLAGKPNTWAAGIVHAIGSENFVFDPTQTPHLTAANLAASFGLAINTVNGKSKQIRDTVKMHLLDWHWMLPSRIDEHPAIWMISVNGIILDARTLRRDLQEEAVRKGLIPYIPAERDLP